MSDLYLWISSLWIVFLHARSHSLALVLSRLVSRSVCLSRHAATTSTTNHDHELHHIIHHYTHTQKNPSMYSDQRHQPAVPRKDLAASTTSGPGGVPGTPLDRAAIQRRRLRAPVWARSLSSYNCELSNCVFVCKCPIYNYLSHLSIFLFGLIVNILVFFSKQIFYVFYVVFDVLFVFDLSIHSFFECRSNICGFDVFCCQTKPILVFIVMTKLYNGQCVFIYLVALMVLLQLYWSVFRLYRSSSSPVLLFLLFSLLSVCALISYLQHIYFQWMSYPSLSFYFLK